MYAEDESTPIEGLFDAQLDLPLSGAAVPSLFTTVTKRDGRTEEFQTRKIAAAIARAANSAAPNEAEHAWDLAKAVRVHLWKQLGDCPPHVDQIHEAVERVLVAMARQRTALSYARYRVRRARRREATRDGNVLPFLRPEEDDHTREALAGFPDALLVRTSADTLAAWDRGRIVSALSRETGLKEHTAEAIALEVEQQIAAARIDALTASLVRELVDAKLAEHGLTEYRERHRRLGVPLYDTALMLRGMLPAATGLGPIDTDRLLARVLKKEYALAEVFSPVVAEAHLRGDLHISALGEIDRYDSAALPLEVVNLNGWTALGSASSPARFLAQWRQAARLLRGYLHGPVAWRGAREALEPILSELGDDAIRQFAEMVLFEFHAPGEPPETPVQLGLDWPAGPSMHEYRAFCHALLDTMSAAAERGVQLNGLLLEVSLEGAQFGAVPPSGDMEAITRAIASGVPILCTFGRAEPPASTNEAHLQSIALNLPRAARQETELGGTEQWLDTVLRAAATAHEEKRGFVEELWARGADGPLAALRAWPGADFFQPGKCPTRIAVDGLREAATLLAREPQEIPARAAELLAQVREACQRVEESTGARLVLAANTDPGVSRRFSALEPQPADDETETGAPSFTTGVDLAVNPPLEATRIHAAFAALLHEDAPLQVRVADAAPASLLALLQKIQQLTTCRSVHFRG